ncbi:MAG: dialkylresorcinol condensing enzyme DarA [Bacteroidales bacterium]|nr:dialkylresorcinol condensing enzyme DarA [Bacteroidales bacterium]
MKKILVIYYTQTGQIRTILDSIISGFTDMSMVEIDYAEIKPSKPYPYPWKEAFYNSFPESVKGIPCQLESWDFDLNKEYDLVLLGMQVWYLSPSIPASSFLQHPEIKIFLRGKNVVTVNGVRNMWYTSYLLCKKYLGDAGAHYQGNIVMYDRTDNYIAGITVIAWMVHGKKKLALFPQSGVSDEDILNAKTYGQIIYSNLIENTLSKLQEALVFAGAVKVKFHLMKIEIVARKIFVKFADFVLKKGSYESPLRKTRVALFKYYLLFVFFILSPFVSIFQMLRRWVFYSSANKQIRIFQGLKP